MIRKGAAFLAMAVCLTGCGSPDEPAANGSGDQKSTPKPSPSRTPSPTPKPTPTPTPTPAPERPKPKDGKDLQACYDGDCEVLVTGPADVTLDGQFGLAQFSITRIAKTGVDFQGITSDGTTASMLGQHPDMSRPSQLNDLELRVIWLDPAGKSAVIRLTTK